MPENESSEGVRIRVPASTSNLGAAFDAVGLALNLYLTVEVRMLERRPSRIEVLGEDAHLVPEDESNYLWRTMREIAAEEGCSLPPFFIRAENQIPISKGLGSSASAIVAAAAAVSYLCELDWNKERLLEIAVEREGHPDNAAPSILGGLVASMTGGKVLCSRSEFPPDWTIIAVTPNMELSTELARSILPDTVSREDAIHNIQRAAFLMAQLVQGRRDGIREAMSDLLHQPYRSELIPGLKEILSMDHEKGLLGIALSGAGSTVIAFAESREKEIGERISGIFKRFGLSAQVRLLRADNLGLVLTPA